MTESVVDLLESVKVEQDYSLKFSHPLLEDFTLHNIRLSLAKRQRNKNFS